MPDVLRYKQQYIQLHHEKPNTANGLIKSVSYDSREPWCVAGAKTLGLLGKFITIPLWRVIEDVSVCIVDMGTINMELTALCASHTTVTSLHSFICVDDAPASPEPYMQH